MQWHPDKSVILNCKIGKDCIIHAFVWIGNNVVIGDRCKIQAFSFIPDGVLIGNDVFIGPHVCFTNDKYPPSDVLYHTVVEDGVSIGANSTVICGITLSKNSSIGAGSVVTKDVSHNALVYGNPAH